MRFAMRFAFASVHMHTSAMMQGQRTELEGLQNRLRAGYCTSEHHKGCRDMEAPDATHGIARGRQLHGPAVLQLCTARHYLPVAAGPGMPSGAWMQRQPRAESSTRCDAKGTASAAGALSNGKAVVHVLSGTALWLTVLDMMGRCVAERLHFVGAALVVRCRQPGQRHRPFGGLLVRDGIGLPHKAADGGARGRVGAGHCAQGGRQRRIAAEAGDILRARLRRRRGAGPRPAAAPAGQGSVSLQQTETCAACAAAPATASGAALGPAAGCKPRQVLSD